MFRTNIEFGDRAAVDREGKREERGDAIERTESENINALINKPEEKSSGARTELATVAGDVLADAARLCAPRRRPRKHGRKPHG